MFLCKKCIDLKKIFAILFSFGNCEECGEKALCADVKFPLKEFGQQKIEKDPL